jgi:hypothetical protein
MAGRAEGAAVVVASAAPRRSAPPSRAAIRVATALTGVGAVQPVGRLCVVAAGAHANADGGRTERIAAVANAARYLAPVVLDLPADGSGAGIAAVADRVLVVGGSSAEPALLDAVAGLVGGEPVKVANRVVDPGAWGERADFILPDSRIGIRAAALGVRAIGSLGSAIGELAHALAGPR